MKRESPFTQADMDRLREILSNKDQVDETRPRTKKTFGQMVARAMRDAEAQKNAQSVNRPER